MASSGAHAMRNYSTMLLRQQPCIDRIHAAQGFFSRLRLVVVAYVVSLSVPLATRKRMKGRCFELKVRQLRPFIS